MQSNDKDEEGYPVIHPYSKCRFPPPLPHKCKWINQPKYYLTGEERGDFWQECQNNQWCLDCDEGYHYVCDNIQEQLSDHFGYPVSLDEITVNNLWSKVESNLLNLKDYSSLSKLDKNLEALINGFKLCQLYRENQYKNCYRNIAFPLLKMDKRHQKHDDRIESFKDDARKKQKQVRSAKRKVVKGKSAKSPKIRSSRKSPKRYVHSSQLSQASPVVFTSAKPKKGKK